MNSYQKKLSKLAVLWLILVVISYLFVTVRVNTSIEFLMKMAKYTATVIDGDLDLIEKSRLDLIGYNSKHNIMDSIEILEYDMTTINEEDFVTQMKVQSETLMGLLSDVILISSLLTISTLVLKIFTIYIIMEHDCVKREMTVTSFAVYMLLFLLNPYVLPIINYGLFIMIPLCVVHMLYDYKLGYKSKYTY